MRRRQLLELWDEMQEQSTEMQKLLRQWVGVHRAVRRASNASAPAATATMSSTVGACPTCGANAASRTAAGNVQIGGNAAAATNEDALPTSPAAMQAEMDALQLSIEGICCNSPASF